MEMNRGSLNPLFARRCAAVRRHLPTYLPRLNLHYTSTTSLSLPRSLYRYSCAHGLFPLRSRARAPAPVVSPALFSSSLTSATPSLSVFPRSSPRVSASSPLLLSASLDCLLARALSLFRASRSTRAAAAAVCPPNYAEFISYEARHACR